VASFPDEAAHDSSAAGAAQSAHAFDRAAAERALETAQVGARSCSTPREPTGTGRVAVVFQADGSVRSVSLMGGFFVGTKAGACVLGKFSTVRVPAFDGEPVRMQALFTIAER
jgi:hypothetical protein